MKNMKTSQNGINLIKKFEGCRLKAYKCAAGVWTIGYGHTSGVKSTDTITEAQAEEYLKADLAKFEANVDKYNSKYGWNQNEFDALVSFAFNIGSIDQLTANGTRSRVTIAEKMLCYNKAGGKVIDGLADRRKAERELFMTPVTKPIQASVQAKIEGNSVVKAVQEWLNLEYGDTFRKLDVTGKATLLTDGLFGPKTKAGLCVALQSYLGIKVDGVFGTNTKEHCVCISEKTSNRKTVLSKIVQAILFCYGYNPQLFQNDFNSNCTDALKQFQKAKGLESDGIAGPLFFEKALK